MALATILVHKTKRHRARRRQNPTVEISKPQGRGDMTTKATISRRRSRVSRRKVTNTVHT